MEKSFSRNKPAYTAPSCEIIEMECPAILCGSGTGEQSIEVIDDGVISQPQGIFSAPRYNSPFNATEED